MSNRLYGAAARSVARKLIDDPYAYEHGDWDAMHARIAEYHQDKRGHVVCGCQVHQAHCPNCQEHYDEMVDA